MDVFSFIAFKYLSFMVCLLEPFLANSCIIFFSGFPGVSIIEPLSIQKELVYPFSYVTTFIVLEFLVTGDLFVTPVCLQPLDYYVYAQSLFLVDLVSLNSVNPLLFSHEGLVPFECSPSKDFFAQVFLAQMEAKGQWSTYWSLFNNYDLWYIYLFFKTLYYYYLVLQLLCSYLFCYFIDLATHLFFALFKKSFLHFLALWLLLLHISFSWLFACVNLLFIALWTLFQSFFLAPYNFYLGICHFLYFAFNYGFYSAIYLVIDYVCVALFACFYFAFSKFISFLLFFVSTVYTACYMFFVYLFLFVASFAAYSWGDFWLFFFIALVWFSGLVCLFNTLLYMALNFHLVRPFLRVIGHDYIEPLIKCVDIFLEQLLTWYFKIEEAGIFKDATSLKKHLFRVYINDCLFTVVVALRFLAKKHFKQFCSYVRLCFCKSPFVILVNPIIFIIQVRLLGLKLLVDLRHYELSWRTLFSVHTFYYGLLQIETLWRFFYSFGFLSKQEGDFKEPPDEPMSERFLQIISFFRPVALDYPPLQKLIVFADFSNIVLYVVYRLLYWIFFFFIALACIFVKKSVGFYLLAVSFKSFFLSSCLRVERTTAFACCKKASYSIFSFCYSLLTLTKLRRSLTRIFCLLVFFVRSFFLLVALGRLVSALYVLIKFFFFLVLRGRIFFIFSSLFVFLGIWLFSVLFVEVFCGLLTFYVDIVYFNFFVWPFYDRFYEATVASGTYYHGFQLRANFYFKIWSGFLQALVEQKRIVQFKILPRGVRYMLIYEYNKFLAFIWKKYAWVAYGWTYGIYLGLEFLMFLVEVWMPFWMLSTWCIFKSSRFYGLVSKPFYELVYILIFYGGLFWNTWAQPFLTSCWTAVAEGAYVTLRGVVAVLQGFLNYLVKESDTSLFFWWLVHWGFYDIFNIQILLYSTKGLFLTLVQDRTFSYILWKSFCFPVLNYWDSLKSIYLTNDWSFFIVNYYLRMRFSFFFDELALHYRLKPLQQKYNGLQLTTFYFLFFDNLFYEHMRSNFKVQTTAGFFQGSFLHWNVLLSSHWLLNNVSHIYDGSFNHLAVQVLALSQRFFLPIFIFSLITFKGFLSCLLLKPQNYFSSQYSWTHFLDLKVREKDLIKQLVELPPAISKLLQLINSDSLSSTSSIEEDSDLMAMGVTTNKTAVCVGSKGGVEPYCYPLWVLHRRYNLREFTAGLDYVNVFKDFLRLRGGSNWCKNEVFINRLVTRWQALEKERFFDYIFSRVTQLSKKDINDQVEERRILDIYNRLYGIDSSLLTKDTPEASLLKEWLKARLASRESYLKAIKTKGLNESTKANYTHWYNKQTFELDKEFKWQVHCYQPAMRHLAKKVFPKGFCDTMARQKAFDIFGLLSNDNKWLFKKGLLTANNFLVLLAYMYRRDASVKHLWAQQPDDLEQEFLEELIDSEFYHEMEFREKYFFEPLYRYFVAVDKLLYGYTMPYWAFHKDLDNDLLFSGELEESHFSISRQRQFRNSKPLDYLRPPTIENNLPENFFFWFWMLPVTLGFILYWGLFGRRNFHIWFELKFFFYNLVTSFPWGFSIEYWLAHNTLYGHFYEESHNSPWYTDTRFWMDPAYSARVIYGAPMWQQASSHLVLHNDAGYWALVLHWLGKHAMDSSRNGAFFIYRVSYWLVILIALYWLHREFFLEGLLAYSKQHLQRLQSSCKVLREQQKRRGSTALPELRLRYKRLRPLLPVLKHCNKLLNAAVAKKTAKNIARGRFWPRLSTKPQRLHFRHFYNLQRFHQWLLQLHRVFYNQWQFQKGFFPRKQSSRKQ